MGARGAVISFDPKIPAQKQQAGLFDDSRISLRLAARADRIYCLKTTKSSQSGTHEAP